MRAITASPTMIGAITTLIVIVAVFLAYNANNGLPFVPTYKVSVEIPNGSRLVNNNEVRIGGVRVGVIESIEARRVEAGEGGGAGDAQNNVTDAEAEGDVVARIGIRLDESAGPLPKDSVFRIRYKSSFGLKYLEITRGNGEDAPENFTFDGTNDVDDPDNVPLSLEDAVKIQADDGEPDDGIFVNQTEFDDIGNTFNQRTRAGARQNLVGFGTAFAGRGGSLNQAIEALNPAFRFLQPVAKALADSDTRFRRLFPELGDAARITAPVAEQQAEVFRNMAIAFGALSEDTEALKAAIEEGPPTLRTGIDLLPDQRPFLADFTELSRRLRPGVRALRSALPPLNDAVRVGTEVLPRTVRMNRQLRNTLLALEDLLEQDSTRATLIRLRETFRQALPLSRHVVPAQTVCNYWNYWFTMLPEHLTERDNVGFTQRVSIIGAPRGQTQAAFALPSPPFPPGLEIPITVPGEVKAPYAGYSGLQSDGIAGSEPNPGDDGEFQPRILPILHGPPYAPTGQRGTNNDCQSGQTGYPLGDDGLAGLPDSNPAVGSSDYPGSRGVTDVFFNQDGSRTLKDTRVRSRQP